MIYAIMLPGICMDKADGKTINSIDNIRLSMLIGLLDLSSRNRFYHISRSIEAMRSKFKLIWWFYRPDSFTIRIYEVLRDSQPLIEQNPTVVLI